MLTEQDAADMAREIIDANLYMVLGTAADTGQPWVTPVYYAPKAYREFLWVSSPGAQHSRNLAMRREVSIVIFDSAVPINTGQAVYMSAVAGELADDEQEQALGIYSRRTLAHGGRAWTAADVQPPAKLRLYCATATEHYILDEADNRIRVTP